MTGTIEIEWDGKVVQYTTDQQNYNIALAENIRSVNNSVSVNISSYPYIDISTAGINNPTDLVRIQNSLVIWKDDNGFDFTDDAGNLFEEPLVSTCFLTFVPGSSGYQPMYTDDPELTYNPDFQLMTVPNVALPATTSTAGRIFSNGNVILHFGGTSSVFLGEGCGNLTNTGTFNFFLGYQGGQFISTATSNIGLGYQPLYSITDGIEDIAIGDQALYSLTFGVNNTAIGISALGALISGDNNLAIGYSAGSTYTTTESSNIVIGSVGVIGESNVLRIGTHGGGALQQNKAYIAGVYNITPASSTTKIVIISDGYQLGTVSTVPTATNLAGGAANEIPYQTAPSTTSFIPAAATSILMTDAKSVPSWQTTIPSSILGNSTLYVGTTAITLNRSSAAQSLTGITSIDGYAAQLTDTATTTNASYYFPLITGSTTGQYSQYVGSGLTFNPSTNTLTTTTFSGALTGNVTGNCSGSSGTCTGNAGSATYSSASTIANDTTTNADMFPTWVTANTGNLPIKVSSTQVIFHPSTGLYTVPSLSATATTDSSSISTGAIVTAGGVGIAKKLYVGTDIHAAGVLYGDSTTDSSSSITGGTILAGGLGIAKKLYVGTDGHVAGVTYADSTTEATTGGEGSLVSAGGLYAAKAIVNGSTTDSSSTTTGAIITAGGAAVAKKLYVGTGIYLATSGGTASELNYYEEYTHTTTLHGIWASDQNATFYIKRIGKIVTVAIPDVRSTANTSAAITMVDAFPARFRPLANQYNMSLAVYDNAVTVQGASLATTAGALTIYKGSFGSFTGSGNSGTLPTTLTWQVS